MTFKLPLFKERKGQSLDYKKRSHKISDSKQ